MAVSSAVLAQYDDPYVSEPEAPTFSLGERILWTSGCETLHGTIRWIGRIPQLCYGWTAGVEFDKPVLNGGDGHFHRKRYFLALSGHALFLPITDIVPESESIKACTHKPKDVHHISSQLEHGTCCSQYQPHCRDSTYGHYRRNCCCSSCSRCDYQCDSHNYGPIYGHISTRPSHDHREQLYESYLNCHPVEQDRVPSFHPRSGQTINSDYSEGKFQFAQCSSDHSTTLRNRCCNGPCHPNANTSIDVRYRESFFSPRATIKLISGLKDWVTCWVLGTSRQKKKQNVLLKGRKTVTSLIVSNTPHSLSKTGKRLSSFSDYSNVDSCTLRRSQSKEKSTTTADLPVVPDNNNTGSRTASCQTKPVKSSNLKHRQYKKRPAPPPPSGPLLKSTEAIQNPVKVKNSIAVRQNTSKKQSTSNISAHSSNIIVKPSTSQNLKGTSVVSAERNRCRTRPKKRKAPLPPVPHVSHHTSEFHINFLRQAEQAGLLVNEGGKHMFRIKNSQTLEFQPMNRNSVTNRSKVSKIYNGEIGDDGDGEYDDDDDDDDDWEIVPKPENMLNCDGNISYGKLLNNIDYADVYDKRFQPSGSKLQPITFSSEDSDGEVSSGITTYQMKPKDNEHTNVPNQFSKNDRRVKISIEKTEMNVVTVEELRGSSDADDQSSVSELSDDGNCVKGNAIEERKSSSSDELQQASESKPIFEELQLTPPSKASVKDFVNAFNMLADRERYGKSNVKKNMRSKIYPKEYDKIKVSNAVSTLANDIESFPTKWQYRQNASNRNFPINHFLLPIQEESHNDSSEPESSSAGVKSEESANVKSKSKLVNSTKADKLVGRDRNQCNSSASLELNVANLADKRTSTEMKHAEKPFASNAAISSLMSSEPQRSHVTATSEGAKAKNFAQGKSRKKAVQSEQPIVVSLYIEDKSSHRGPIPFIVTPSMSLRKLKKKVEKEYNFDKDLQCWILGQTFAIHDEASLASYGVIQSGSPILLYVMSVESRTKSLPHHTRMKQRKIPIYDDVARSDGTDSEDDGIENLLDREVGRNWKSDKSLSKAEKAKDLQMKPEVKHMKRKTNSSKRKAPDKSRNEFQNLQRNESPEGKGYQALVELDDVDLVINREPFECPVCFLDIEAGNGAILQDCLHSFCKECLAGAVEFSETAVIKCPFRNDEYSCESHLQEREIKSLVSPESFERHLQKSMVLAERQALDSFHCKTPDCPGWCLFEDNVNTFYCPVCKHTNCLTCGAIHEGRNCRQYQDDVANQCDSSEEAKKTKEYLEKMVQDGDAMHCPKCEVILMKKWGCDWLKCSMCHTEVCWVTKGPRWGPGGRGDTSGGCKCMLNGVRCHPKCSYCH